MTIRYTIDADPSGNPDLFRLKLVGLFDMLGAKAEIVDEERPATPEEDSAQIIEYPPLRLVWDGTKEALTEAV